MSSEVSYKSFNEEESKIYTQAIEKIRSNIKNGLKFDLACEFIALENKDLKDFIIDDALKIEIAELHYGKGLPLADVAKRLGLPMERILKANGEMLEDIMNTGISVREDSGEHSQPTTH